MYSKSPGQFRTGSEGLPKELTSEGSQAWNRLNQWRLDQKLPPCPPVWLKQDKSSVGVDNSLGDSVSYVISSDGEYAANVRLEPHQLVQFVDGSFVPRRELYIAWIGRAGASRQAIKGVGKSTLAVLADFAASQNAVVGSNVITPSGMRAFQALVAAGIYQHDPFGGIYSIPVCDYSSLTASPGSHS